MVDNAQRETEVTAIAGMWWLWLVTGILWVVIALVILQFDSMSVAAVGVLVGVMLVVAGAQYIFTGIFVEGWKWLWFLFGGLFIVAGVVAMAYPTRTFTAIADVLGFLFALIALVWIVEAFVTRDGNPLWWLSLVAGILMLLIAFWAGGQFFFTKAYTLLAFAGVWALMRGIVDIVGAFQVRSLGKIAAG
ncbi:MAG: hypothetical protein EHM57_00050 [Actinobacteria bacterium]|nr:MAG: hypothetical protein EHM57_00050 [Actinomycetota bacterium]